MSEFCIIRGPLNEEDKNPQTQTTYLIVTLEKCNSPQGLEKPLWCVLCARTSPVCVTAGDVNVTPDCHVRPAGQLGLAARRAT